MNIKFCIYFAFNAMSVQKAIGIIILVIYTIIDYELSKWKKKRSEMSTLLNYYIQLNNDMID